MKKPVLISFTGRANSGKTTLIMKLLQHYSALGYETAVIKSTNHTLSLPGENKDTGKFFQSGASASLVTDGNSIIIEAAAHDKRDPVLIASKFFNTMDIVFIEGFKKSSLRKIEVIGDSPEAPLYTEGIENIEFLVSDNKENCLLPCFKRDDIAAIVHAVDTLFL